VGLKPGMAKSSLECSGEPTAEDTADPLDEDWLHTFRRTFALLLKANGEDVKLVPELCRHANANTTLRLYAQAFTNDARRARKDSGDSKESIETRRVDRIRESRPILLE